MKQRQMLHVSDFLENLEHSRFHFPENQNLEQLGE